MRFTVHYIPLSKIKPDPVLRLAKPLQFIRNWMADCLHILAVRRNKKDGSYTLIGGRSRYEYLLHHTSKKYAPCIIEEAHSTAAIRTFVQQLLQQQAMLVRPEGPKGSRLLPASWSMIREFLRQTPRFRELSPFQQLQVLVLAIRYRKTVLLAMQSKMDELLEERLP